MFGRAAAALALLLIAGAARAQAPDSEPAPTAAERFVVRNFEANKVALDQAPGLTQAIATRMAEANLKVVSPDDIQKAVGLDRQRELLGCSGDAACAIELAGALDARYVVSGRVDRFNQRYLLSATVWDQRLTEVKVKSQREVADAGLLSQAMEEIADELLAPFGVPPKVEVKLADRVDSLGFNLGLKLGTTLLTSLFRLAPVGEIELGFRISHAWLVILQIGFGIAFDQTTQTNVGLTPGLLGLRYHFRAEKDLQPTLGGGLGVITTIAAARGKARLSALLNLGLLYLITQRVSASVEASMDVLGLAYGVAEKTSALTGINFGLSLGINYRF
ncbi:MAG: hypothetical protein H6Q89_100 [Myxococcaceae bacterium]|nr:hypothetical protein [Myxococcaceae bacterium]